MDTSDKSNPSGNPSSNPVEEAKRLMESIRSKQNNSTEEPIEVNPYKEPPVLTPHENLILQSQKHNQLIPEGGLNVKPNTYERILVILKDGGMDSMSQQKALTAIKELLNESIQTIQE